ncbi:MAG: Ig-like domain-containing protein [Oscillospiraceae bacterium]|nr:Ig-like domain-containing protein [Oscillospiraceae bacterium]
MKRSFSIFLAICLILGSLGILVYAKEIPDLVIERPPAKTIYLEGDTFDSAGLVLRLAYKDSENDILLDTQEDFDLHNISFTAGTGLVPDSYFVIYTYALAASQMVALPITVNAKRPVSLTILNSSPVPDGGYKEEMPFSVEGMTAKIDYDNGVIRTVGAGELTTDVDTLAAGENVVTVTYTDENNKSVSTVLTINAAKKILTALEIVKAPTKTSYIEENALNLGCMVVEAVYDNGTRAAVTPSFTPANGTVLKTGNNKVTASFSFDGVTKTAEQTITVAKKSVSSLTVTKPKKTTFVEGEKIDTSAMKVTANYNNGTKADVTKDAVFSPKNGAKIKLSHKNLKVSFGGKSQSFPLKVIPAPTSVKFSATSKTLGVGEVYNSKITVAPKGAAAAATYSSKNKKVAKVNKNGVITAVGVGTTQIVAKTTHGGKQAVIKITVKPALTKLSRTTPSTMTIGVGESFTTGVKVNPTGAKSTRKYKVNNKNAKVNTNGKVTGVAPGKAKVTVTAYNGVKTSFNFDVKKAPNKVSLNQSKVTLRKGGKVTLKAKLPSGTASNKLTWSTGSSKIATVDKNGVVTAKGIGSVRITVTTFNGKTASCVVTVK